QAAFREAVHGLVARHPVLRTGFQWTEAGWVQFVKQQVTPSIVVYDLRGQADAAQEAQLQAWYDDERTQGFTWSEAPLMRFFVHQRGDQRFQFGLSFHHAILDGWSVATLLTEFFRDYAARLRGAPIALEAPRAHYRDFVALDQQTARSDEARRFWEAQLAGAAIRPLPSEGDPEAPEEIGRASCRE